MIPQFLFRQLSDPHTLSISQDVLSVEGPLSLKLLDVLTLILNYSVSQAIDVKSGESSTMLIDLIASLAFFSVNNRRHQDLLISEQFAVIFKSLAKLSSQFNPVIYPFLVTMCYNNAPARELISRDFDLRVSDLWLDICMCLYYPYISFSLQFLDEYSKSDAAKRNRLIQMMHNPNSNKNSSNNRA